MRHQLISFMDLRVLLNLNVLSQNFHKNTLTNNISTHDPELFVYILGLLAE